MGETRQTTTAVSFAYNWAVNLAADAKVRHAGRTPVAPERGTATGLYVYDLVSTLSLIADDNRTETAAEFDPNGVPEVLEDRAGVGVSFTLPLRGGAVRPVGDLGSRRRPLLRRSRGPLGSRGHSRRDPRPGERQPTCRRRGHRGGFPDRSGKCTGRKPWGDGLRAGLDASSDGGLDLSMMERLEFAPLPQPTGQRMWFPFGTAPDAHGGFEPRWWGGPIWNVPERTLFLVLRTTSGEEVARARLDWDFPIDVYPSARALHARPVLEIQYLEVHSAFRRAGVGRNLIERTQAAFPDSQLMALSEGADGFWASLGWSRHRHEEDDGSTDHYQPLYLAP